MSSVRLNLTRDNDDVINDSWLVVASDLSRAVSPFSLMLLLLLLSMARLNKSLSSLSGVLPTTKQWFSLQARLLR
jgi:hypothetical protein